MSTAILAPQAAALERIKALVLDTLPSVESKRVYSRALDDFFRWCVQDAVSRTLSKATVSAYRSQIEAHALSGATINIRLSAIRKPAIEAADNGLMNCEVAAAIARVKGTKREGIRTGRWLTREQAERLISAPNPATMKGKRDRALLAVLVGCGLRRKEAAALAVHHVHLREARWVIVELVGKGGGIRTVHMPSWAKAAIDAWTSAAPITGGLIFRALLGRTNQRGLNPGAVSALWSSHCKGLQLIDNQSRELPLPFVT